MCEGYLIEEDGIEVLQIEIPEDIEVIKVSLAYIVLILSKENI